MQAIRKAGGIPPLVALLSSEHELVLEGAAGAMLNLASGNPDNQEALREAEAAPALLAIAREVTSRKQILSVTYP
jgi:HEAT repeat protein